MLDYIKNYTHIKTFFYIVVVIVYIFPSCSTEPPFIVSNIKNNTLVLGTKFKASFKLSNDSSILRVVLCLKKKDLMLKK